MRGQPVSPSRSPSLPSDRETALVSRPCQGTRNGGVCLKPRKRLRSRSESIGTDNLRLRLRLFHVERAKLEHVEVTCRRRTRDIQTQI